MKKSLCPVCQKGLSLKEALKLKFICPQCQTPLKWKSSKVLVILSFVLGMILGALVSSGLWLYALFNFALIVTLFVISLLTGRFEKR